MPLCGPVLGPNCEQQSRGISAHCAASRCPCMVARSSRDMRVPPIVGTGWSPHSALISARRCSTRSRSTSALADCSAALGSNSRLRVAVNSANPASIRARISGSESRDDFLFIRDGGLNCAGLLFERGRRCGLGRAALDLHRREHADGRAHATLRDSVRDSRSRNFPEAPLRSPSVRFAEIAARDEKPFRSSVFKR
jgi:hypothetical protein